MQGRGNDARHSYHNQSAGRGRGNSDRPQSAVAGSSSHHSRSAGRGQDNSDRPRSAGYNSSSRYDPRVDRLQRAFRNMGIFNFRFTKEEINYISNPYDCAWRNEFIQRPDFDVNHICDAFACVGGDTVQFMKLKPSARIDAVQIVVDGVTRDRYARLQENIESCKSLNSSTSAHATPIKDFIMSDGLQTVDFLYCDPPWTTVDAEFQVQWFTAEEIIYLLKLQIGDPLKQTGARPKYICFKVPPEWSEFSGILEYFPGYRHLDSHVFHANKYWMHFITSG